MSEIEITNKPLVSVLMVTYNHEAFIKDAIEGVLAQNSDGEVISGYTANNGFWMNNEGNVCGWGEEGCAIYIEYDANTSFNVGQFPGATTSGDVYDYTLIMVYDGKYIKYNVAVTIE